MNSELLCNEARELEFRIKGTIVLAAEQPDSLTKVCSDLFEEEPELVLEVLPEVHPDFHDRDNGELDGEFIDWLQTRGIFGFLLIVETPVRRVMGKGEESWVNYGWGCYTSLVVYGETMDSALQSAIEAVREYKASQEPIDFKLD